MNKKNKIILISTLMLIELVSLFLMYKSSSNNIVKLDEVSLAEEEISSEMFAVMLEQADGTYTESDAFPTEGYFFDSIKSGCMDINGNKIEGVLSYDDSTKTASVDTGKTSYCYLYFNSSNLKDLCKNYADLATCMASEYDTGLTTINNLSTSDLGGMRRYQGEMDSVNNNYICFGTKDKNECINNADLYMYRIIGIQADGKIKLLKKEAINGKYSWSQESTNILWKDSDIYKGLNGIEDGFYGNVFVNSNEYDYMSLDGEWYLKINTYNWKYGLLSANGGNSGASGTSGDTWFEYENTLIDTVDAKIGLMYVHDYVYSGYTTTDNGIRRWTHIARNDPDWDLNNNYMSEWLMTNGLLASESKPYYIVGVSGLIYLDTAHTATTIRPVFYLNSDLSIIDGNGKIDNPYIIS